MKREDLPTEQHSTTHTTWRAPTHGRTKLNTYTAVIEGKVGMEMIVRDELGDICGWLTGGLSMGQWCRMPLDVGWFPMVVGGSGPLMGLSYDLD